MFERLSFNYIDQMLKGRVIMKIFSLEWRRDCFVQQIMQNVERKAVRCLHVHATHEIQQCYKLEETFPGLIFLQNSY